jgi:hypothetical protein
MLYALGLLLQWDYSLLFFLFKDSPLKPIRPNIIDFEASGFGVDSYPIEVGVALSNGQTYCALIKPDDAWQHWDFQAEQVHGLSLEIVCTHGKSISTVARELNALLENKTVYSDGWVVDKPWMSELFYRSGLEPNFFISSLEYILKESQMEIWNETQQQVIADLSLTRHRASTDALIIQETYARTQQVSTDKNQKIA